MTKITKFYENVNIYGELSIKDGSQADGYLLMSDSGGTGTWVSQSTLTGGTSGNAKYTLTTGFTSGVTITVPHTLGTLDLLLQVKDLGSNELIGVTVDNYQLNSVDITANGTIASARIIILAAGSTGSSSGDVYVTGGTVSNSGGTATFTNNSGNTFSVTGFTTYAPTANTVFVSKNGVNATGLVERMDKPFLTIAAALSAALAYYTGGNAPSATNRILIKVFSGNYTEQITLSNFIDYDLGDAVITNNPAISDGGASCNSILFGNSRLNSAANNVMNLTGGGLIRVFADEINGRVAATTSTNVIINARTISDSGSANNLLFCSGGGKITVNNCILTGTSIAGVGGLIQINGGAVTLNSCIAQSNTELVVEMVTSIGSVTINNSRLETNGTNKSCISIGAGSIGSTVIVNNTTLIASGSGNSIVATSAQNVKVYGGCQTNKALYTGITQQVGTIIVDTNVV